MFYAKPAEEIVYCRRKLRQLNDKIMFAVLQQDVQMQEALKHQTERLMDDQWHWALAINEGIRVA
jgi:hypothetical protein